MAVEVFGRDLSVHPLAQERKPPIFKCVGSPQLGANPIAFVVTISAILGSTTSICLEVLL